MEGRTHYERTDNYNVHGIFCYFALRMRNAFMKWTNINYEHSALKEIPAKYGNVNSHIYTLELFQPLLIFAMESKSETIRNLAYEQIHILTYLL